MRERKMEKATSDEMPEKKIQTTSRAQSAMTPDELALFHRTSAEEHGWQTITEGDMKDFSLELDPNRLPECFQKLQDEKKFAFRWVERTPEAIDRRRRAPNPLTWYMVNSTAPLGIPANVLAQHIDGVMGGVIKADLVLMYKPWWMHERRNDSVRERTRIQEQGGILHNRDGKPAGEGMTYLAGKQYAIDEKHDEVLIDEAQFDTINNQSSSGSSELEDVVIE